MKYTLEKLPAILSPLSYTVFFDTMQNVEMNQFTFWYENCLMSGLVHSFRRWSSQQKWENKMHAWEQCWKTKIICPHAYKNRHQNKTDRTNTEWNENLKRKQNKNERFSIRNEREKKNTKKNTLPYRKFDYHTSWRFEWKMSVCVQF